MKTRDFAFDLPTDLIAQRPLPDRKASRMLVYQRVHPGAYIHTHFHQLPTYLKPGDLLVFNHSKVIPARLYACKETGGKVEILVERCLSDKQFLAHMRASKAIVPGTVLSLIARRPSAELPVIARRPSADEAIHSITVKSKHDGLYLCEASAPIMEMMQVYGNIPLPPYIQRTADEEDRLRYQTVYAKEAGSVAAPTAGLHFDETVLEQLKAQGVEFGYTTLHVGAGTFKPVRSDKIDEHVMHAEWMEVNATLCNQINQAKKEKRRIIAVGTTALRALETAGRKPYTGETSIFIKPGYAFQVVDGLLTNFHLPETTLLMLVAALIGHEQTLCLYQEAIAKAYRFFSYGDVSLLI